MATDVLGFLDRCLIALYRTTGHTYLDYLAGTFVLALLTVMMGEWTISLALKWNRSHNQKLERELEEKHHLSLAALEANDEAPIGPAMSRRTMFLAGISLTPSPIRLRSFGPSLLRSPGCRHDLPTWNSHLPTRFLSFGNPRVFSPHFSSVTSWPGFCFGI